MTPSFPTRRSSDLQLADRAWPGGAVEGVAAADQEGEDEQQPRRHHVEKGDEAQPRRRDEQEPLRADQHPPAIELVGDRARQQRERSEEHTSELQSLMRTSYAVFCLKKKNDTNTE